MYLVNAIQLIDIQYVSMFQYLKDKIIWKCRSPNQPVGGDSTSLFCTTVVEWTPD